MRVSLKKIFLSVIASVALIIIVSSCGAGLKEFDVVIKGGMIVDGSGNKPFSADVGVRDGRIVFIGDLRSAVTEKTLDAKDKLVVPGFIDVHTHVERRILVEPALENYTRQGVTTVVGGNCGSSEFPIGEFFGSVEDTGIAVNIALLVGHNTIRRKVMGRENRKPTPDELEDMKELVCEAMIDGAVGISTGLKYIPGAYADTDEVLMLARVAAEMGGVYASHIRDEGLKLLESVNEAIEIGRKTGIPVQLSHHKAIGKAMWGSSVKTLELVDNAVTEGLDITLDQYPYTATSTGLTVVFPAWSLAGGQDEIKKRLDDPVERGKVKEGIVWNIVNDRGGGDPASIVIASYAADTSLVGMNVAEITVKRGLEPTAENAAETIMDMQYEGRASAIYHCLSEEDVMQIMKHPRMMVASDGSAVSFGVARPHPRSYGTYPRMLGRYVREKKVIELSEAIRKMTSLPAGKFKLDARGSIEMGSWADIVVLDYQRIIDEATWEAPHRYATGIEHVIVNGEVVIEDGERRDIFPGQVLYGPGKK